LSAKRSKQKQKAATEQYNEMQYIFTNHCMNQL